MLKKALLYFHTIRHLKLRQLYYQVYYRLVKVKLRLSSFANPKVWQKKWQAPLLNKSLWDGEERFSFLNESSQIIQTQDWQATQKSRLWLYNLHYLDVLNTLDATLHKDKLEALVLRWISENPVLTGPGWEPYCLSLRLVNLIKWLSREQINNPTITESLSKQAEALENQLEYHILANHLFANAKALIFVGTFLQGIEASRWLNTGLNILNREVAVQFLSDGGHFEGSPMYHAILLWDLCDLINLADCSQHPRLLSLRSTWVQTLKRGLSWLQHMNHPDGDLAFFNDTAFNNAPSFKAISEYAKLLGIEWLPESLRVAHLNESGYIAVNLEEAGKLIVDVANILPSYQPGHAHADALSFELSLFGKRVFVNSGTSSYQDLSLRSMQRSTKAHNAIEINNKNSSNVWGAFRVAKRASVDVINLSRENDNIFIEASHSGYKRMLGGVLHVRSFKIRNHSISIVDKLDGGFQKAIANFYLHPEIEVRQQDENSVLLTVAKQTVHVHFSHPLFLEDSFWYPEFGKAIVNKHLQVLLTSNRLETTITPIASAK
jgi:uncharacterized heparinase superfamily protein